MSLVVSLLISSYLEKQIPEIRLFCPPESSSKKKAIIGGVVGGAGGLILIILALFVWYQLYKKPKAVQKGMLVTQPYYNFIIFQVVFL